MTKRVILSALVAIALASCGENASVIGDDTPPSPALWEVKSADGTLEGWLFGTIHTLPGGSVWETPTLTNAIDSADLLIVEIAGLDDSAAVSAIFSRLAQTPGQAPLTRRLPAVDHAALTRLMDKAGYDAGDFSAIESWAAALMLAQSLQGGDPENGVDRVLLRRFRGRPVQELEGTERQLGIFDRLSETDQRDMLGAVVKESLKPEGESARLAKIWRAGDMAALANENSQGLLADPELRDALLVRRNDDWAAKLATILPSQQPALIAVGAAHMAGPEGLPVLLEKRGYTVTRIQ